MMLAQNPIDWAMTLEHSVTVGVILFGGYGLSWIAVRLFGREGIIAQMNDTMREIKDLVGNQQVVCTQHAGAMNHMCAAEEAMSKQIGEAIVIAASDRDDIRNEVGVILDHTTKMDMWQRQNPNEFKAIHAFDAILALVNTAERISERLEHGEAVLTDIRQVRAEITEIRARIQDKAEQ